MIRRPPRSTPLYSSAASDVYKRQSLYFPLSSTKSTALKWTNCVWKRVTELSEYSKFSIIADKISPNDIVQGTLSDYYFLSALAILAETPSFIIPLFVSTEINEFGIFAVRMYRDGIEKTVIVDNYFPCTSDGMPLFSRSRENALWVAVLEKAWAKLHLSYSLIDRNTAQVDSILETLTGAHCLVMNHDDDELWNSLIEGKKKGWIMSASAANTKASKELLEEMKLAGNFAYAILDVMEVDVKDTSESIVKLRNPWGTMKWAKEWSDSSNIWTEELRRDLDWDTAKSAEEKVFWMTFSDFCHYFSRIQICKVDASCVHSSLRLSLTRRPSCIRVHAKTSGTGLITIHQPDNDYYEYKDYKYLLVRLIIVRLEMENDKKTYIYIKGDMKMDRELCEEYKFDPGDYLLYIEAEKNFTEESKSILEECKNEVPITLSLYAPKDITLKSDEWAQHPQFLEQVYSSCAVECGEYLSYDSDGAPDCSKYSGMMKEGYGYTYFHNNSDDATIKEAVNYTMFDGLELVPPFKGTSYEVLVPPKSSAIVLMKQTSITGINLSFSYTSIIIFTTEAMKKRIKKFGTRVMRKDPHVSGDIDIFVYTFKHGGGICYLYENLTNEYVLEEHVKFKTNGLKLVGEEGNEITIKIGPGESKFVELKAVTSNWNIQNSVSYGISSIKREDALCGFN
eukprot:TRINITY_DN9374_c0_g2_i3.p1 TRINITY_DN9374_c0_g2~~TRINITY_DN9374_c0_g2_i3.p1  ORF type:complete len:688 (-),score=197.77 TRINITY_DN9374_c0_g2_i3:35-2074(-)